MTSREKFALYAMHAILSDVASASAINAKAKACGRDAYEQLAIECKAIADAMCRQFTYVAPKQ